MQLSLFSTSETTELKDGFSLEAIFDAYFSCRSNKRNTINALAFGLALDKVRLQRMFTNFRLNIQSIKEII